MTVLSDGNPNQLGLKISEDILKEISIPKSHQLLQSVIDKTDLAIAVLDERLCYLMVSDRWLQDYNLAISQVINTHYSEVVIEKFCCEQSIYQDCLNQGISQQIEQKITNQYGITKQLQLSTYPWRNQQNKISGIIVFSQLQKNEFDVELFFDLSLDMLCIAGLDGYFKRVNPAFTEALGYSASELTARPFLSFVHPEDIKATLTEMEKLKQEIASVEFENRYCCQDGSYRRLRWITTPSPKNRNLIYAVARDVSQFDDLQQKLSWQSKHDFLTGLLNRQEFQRQINQVIALVKNTDEQHAFCYFDLDRFKIINEIYGHFVGDCLLRQVTILIKEELEELDIFSRLEGDKFGILLKNCSLKSAEKTAHKLRQVIKDYNFIWQDQKLTLGASIGLVTVDKNSVDFSHLLSAADTACYAAKEQGRNWVRVYHPEDRELAQKRGERHWISKLNLALEENRFCLYCQKITPLQINSGTDHYEILLRLFDRDGNLIPPMAFIPAAERYDLMPTIDRWVISNFLDSYQNHCQLNKKSGFCDTIYTINLSGASINSDQFFVFLKEQFAFHNVAPETICFEITETAAINNLSKAARFISEIKELGCFFALDDFGSGMSSLNYLKNLPIDYLKIDGNFVKNIVNDPIDRATVECFNRIGEVMNIQTIAEFVENDDIIAQLKEIGVNYAQGYGIDKPAPLCFK